MNDLYYLTDEQRAIRDLARELSRERIAPMAAHVDETEEYPAEQLKRLGQQGLMGLHVPEEYGGTDAGTVAFCLAAEEVAWACAATSTIFLVQNLGGYPIVLGGSVASSRAWPPGRSPPPFPSPRRGPAPTPRPSRARRRAGATATS